MRGHLPTAEKDASRRVPEDNQSLIKDNQRQQLLLQEKEIVQEKILLLTQTTCLYFYDL